jgi:hypothetical protein
MNKPDDKKGPRVNTKDQTAPPEPVKVGFDVEPVKVGYDVEPVKVGYDVKGGKKK